ncbi:hypothetical protein [Burkholderia ubonensis]|uniref:hypothetical protein n=1 Tax=Burkholderia ubonensis TaxID=101571 RepID=UPI000F5B08B5|nr:hypothetical protein [Burkholderia ubonensis]
MKATDCTCYVVRFELNHDGEHDAQLIFPDFTVNFNASQLSELLKTLGRVRLNMLPEVSLDWPVASQNTESIAFPRWKVDFEAMSDGALLHILHPGFGWLAFTIAGDCLVELRDALSEVISDNKNCSVKFIN